MMENRLIRFLMALTFLATATFGAAGEAHALCDRSPPDAQHQLGNAQHQSASAHQHSDHNAGSDQGIDVAAQINDTPEPDSSAADLAAMCHSGTAGCAGCTTASENTVAGPSLSKASYDHISVSGESLDPAGNLRPPQFS